MSDHCYPGFEPGQTLTADDLNVLRAFLDEEGRITRRMIGFGTVCGLEGSIDGTAIVISAGLGIDQGGDGALIPEDVRLETSDVDADAFGFIETGPGGFTPVLVLEDVEEPAPECGEEDCEGHSSLWCRAPRIALVQGRLVVDANDFATDPLLSQEPVTVSQTGAVHGSFVGLRNAISSRWTATGITLSAEAIGTFTTLTLEGDDLDGVKAFKAAFLNQVLFATLDLLRCMSLFRAVCLREEGDRGIALGWAHSVGPAMEWDCRYRHHYAPPTGLVLALLGGGCNNPCDLYRDRLESLITNFRVPVTPQPEDPPSTDPPDKGDFEICKPRVGGYWGRIRECPGWKIPPEEILVDWRDWFIPMPEDEFVNPADWWTDPPKPHELYGQPPMDFLEAGTITLTPALGREPERTGGVLEELVADHGHQPDIMIVNTGDVGDIVGFTYEATVGLGDTMVLVVDDFGKVAATGRVAAATTLESAGAAIGNATDLALSASALAEEASTLVGGFDERIAGTEVAIGEFDDFRTETVEWRREVEPRIDGIDRESWMDDAGRLVDDRISVAVRGVEERITGIEQHTTALETQLAFSAEAIRTQGGRLDDLYKFSLVEGAGSKQLATNRQLVDVLSTMRTSLALTATGDQAEEVRTELARADEALATLEASTTHGQPVVEAAPQELATVIESLVSAAGHAGVPRAEMRRLERDAATLNEMLR